MTHFKTLCGTTAIVTALSATTAFADVTAAEVWGDWKEYMTNFGYEISATENMSGKTLTVSDIVMTVEIPDTDQDIGFNMGTVTFTETGDGSVSVTLPESMPMNMNFEAAPGENISLEAAITQSGFNMIVSGESGDMNYIYGAASIGMNISKFEVTGVKGDAPTVNNVSFAMNDVSGSTHATMKDGMRSYDQATKSSGMVFNIDVAGPESDPGVLKMKGTIADIVANGVVSMPDGIKGQFATNMSAAIEAGFAMKGGYTFGAGQSTFNFAADEGVIDGTSSSEGGTLDVAMSAAEGLVYGGTSNGLKANVTVPQLPMPIDFTMAESGFKLAMPITAGEELKDFGLGIRMIDFSVPDIAYAMIDPMGQLPRDPVTIDIDLSGKAKMFASLMDQKAMASGDAPGEVHAATINTLNLKVAGAELNGSGDFTFDNSDKTTFPGMPAPEGALDLKLAGANGLMDKLVAIGILPEQQAMSVRMMMGLFAVAGEEPDTLTSKIEVTGDGQVLANGQRLK